MFLQVKHANASSDSVAGTMINRGAWNSSPTASGKVTIPSGYHNGSGYVNTAGVYTTGYNAGKASASVDLKRVRLDKDKTTCNSDFGHDYIWVNNNKKDFLRVNLDGEIVDSIIIDITEGTMTCAVDLTHSMKDEVITTGLKYV